MVFLGLHWVSAFLLVLHFNSCIFGIHHIYPYIFLPLLLFLATNSVIFHLLLCSSTGMLWCNHIIFPLNSPSGMYILPSFITILSSIFHSLSFNIFIPTLFNSSTAFTTFSFLSCAFLIFSFRFSFSIIVSALLIYSSFINFWSSLSFSTPSYQPGLLLNSSVFPMLFPGTCFSAKLNCNRYRAYLACLWFNFWFVIKYWRFL